MIRFTHGNLFDSTAQTLVNTVNCVGVMGKGLAKEFKDRWPGMFREYQTACRGGELRSGKPFLYRELGRQILCFPTKDNWKGPSKYEFIEEGLRALRVNHQAWGITSIAFPALGCGLGGLEWEKVKALMEKHLKGLAIDVEIYAPAETDLKVNPTGMKQVVTPVKITLPLALVGEVIRRARAAMPAQHPLGKLLAQKFVFFAQLAGAPTRLRYAKYKFGPYDHNLNHMIERLEGLYIRDESPTWSRSDLRMLDEVAWRKAISPMTGEIKRNSKYLDAAVDLLKGRSLHEVELLSTVQYGWCELAAGGMAGTDEEVEDYVRHWSKEKEEKFSSTQIRGALETLRQAGWLGPMGPGMPSPLLDPVPEVGTAVLA